MTFQNAHSSWSRVSDDLLAPPASRHPYMMDLHADLQLRTSVPPLDAPHSMARARDTPTTANNVD